MLIGTTTDSGFKVNINSSTTALNVGNQSNSVLALSTFSKNPQTTGYGTASNYLQLGAGENGLNGTRLIGFGYSITSNTNQPAYIGYIETLNVGETNGALIFGTRSVTTDTAPTERMRITSGGLVGIGTTSPVQKLHVEGSTAIGTTGTEDILLLGRAIGAGASFQQAASLKLGRYQNAGGSFESYTRLDFALRDNSAASNYNTNTTVMTLTNAGNVGIGATNPGYKLDITNSVAASTSLDPITLRLYNGSDGGSAIYFQNSVGGQSKISFGVESTGAGTDDSYLGFSTGSNTTLTEQMRIVSNGVVLIGHTTNDIGKLDVTVSPSSYTPALGLGVRTNSAEGNSTGISFKTKISISGVIWENARIAAVTESVTSSAYGALAFYTMNATSLAERMRISPSGNVGIFDNGPVYKLSVNNGTAALTTAHFWNYVGDQTATTFILKSARPDIMYHMQIFNNNTTECFRIEANGNVKNTNSSYGSLSDIKIKENISDATPKLDDLLKVRIRNYNIIGQDVKQIGVIAQELEEIFPSMVDENQDRDNDGNLLETTTKGVKYSVFVPMLIKAIQELKAELDELKNNN